MPQVFAIANVPDDIDGAGATDGAVWTADGANGAGWEAPSGGAAFAFDGATFTPGNYVAGSGVRTVDIELTLSGAPITVGRIGFFLTVISGSGNTWTDGGFDVNGTVFRFYLYDSIFAGIACLQCAIDASDGHVIAYAEIYNSTEADKDDLSVQVMLPSGFVVTSAAIVVPATTP